MLDLHLSMGGFTVGMDYGPHNKRTVSVRRSFASPLDEARLGWEATLCHLKNLKRLEMFLTPLGTPHVMRVVELAVEFCPKLEALLLPGQHWPGDRRLRPDPVQVEPVLEMVYKGLKKWKGLRQLAVPTLDDGRKLGMSAKFIEMVAKYCPNVEYLDGYKQSLCERYCLVCRQSWLLTLGQWERFNAACTSLREFNWVVAPFGDPYFRVFGQHVKPQLKKLTFSINMLWDWEKFFAYCDEAGASQESSGYGTQASDVRSALKGCPALEELVVNLYHPYEPPEGEPYTYLEGLLPS